MTTVRPSTDRQAPASSSRPPDQDIGELVKQATEQMSELVRSELRLAKAEITEKGRHAGMGVGLFGGAGLVALYGAGALVAVAIAALALVLPVWAAALIVAAALFVLAGVLAATGRRQTKQVTPPVPEQAIEGVRRDVTEVKGRAHR